MRAVRIHQFGGPEVLTYEDVPDPALRKDHVMVRVRACSLNHLDVWVRKGLPGVKLPHILGSDIAGEVAGIGDYVSGFKTGQRVLVAPMHFCGHCEKCVEGLQNQCRTFTVLGNGVDGGNCELIAVPPANVIPIPESLDFAPAATGENNQHNSHPGLPNILRLIECRPQGRILIRRKGNPAHFGFVPGHAVHRIVFSVIHFSGVCEYAT